MSVMCNSVMSLVTVGYMKAVRQIILFELIFLNVIMIHSDCLPSKHYFYLKKLFSKSMLTDLLILYKLHSFVSVAFMNKVFLRSRMHIIIRFFMCVLYYLLSNINCFRFRSIKFRISF